MLCSDGIYNVKIFVVLRNWEFVDMPYNLEQGMEQQLLPNVLQFFILTLF